MRAMICRAWGAPSELRLEEIDAPQPAADQVRIRILASCVNYADTIMIKGHYQTRPDFPFAPGLEACGEVTECGSAVTRFKSGDRVTQLPCGHFFHHGLAKGEGKECDENDDEDDDEDAEYAGVLDWLKNTHTCPNCTATLPTCLLDTSDAAANHARDCL